MAKQKFNPTWSELDNINYLQRKIIKLSIAYYEMDYSFIDDSSFDELCYQLVDMQKSEVAKKSRYWYMMSDFDGSTGADLYYRLNDEDKNWLWWVVEKEIYFREHPLILNKPVKKKKRKGRLF